MKPLVLIILDGFGYSEEKDGNSIALAQTPNYSQFLTEYPHTLVETSGAAVGLPDGVMGNSEVGHLTIGSGRIHYQDLTKISKAVEDKLFFKNQVLLDAFQKAKKSGASVHLMGLLSDAGVHSHTDHLYALIKMAKDNGVTHVVVHGFMDGRDTSPKSGVGYVKDLQKNLQGIAEIGSLIGRYYAMDRDKRWDRVQIAYEALVERKGLEVSDPVAALEESYKTQVTDEFIKPILVATQHPSQNRILEGDVVIFFNFRPDRARELTEALTDENFSGFLKNKKMTLGDFVCMTGYGKSFTLPVAFPQTRPTNTLAEIISRKGLTQFHTAETEKYAHVTYFLNGGVETPFPGEERLLIQSPKDVATYDEKPEMSARAVCDGVLEKLRTGVDVVFVNFANPDMVGHTGKLPQSIQAVEVIDECLGKIVTESLARNGTVLITADHGNCEQMFDENGEPHTQHTTNPVPFVLINNTKNISLHKGGLADIAPTILKLLNLPQPSEMTGKTLIN
ncbi:MAG: 2,3-bisphosphoglycerate-independent phosphoglycerate mutase [Deltaproteobacteria bacterium]|nr:MAG: 2,3-bisphosphoglycerate-independent phosphoglycerate mutase [Deltaproteobacteria bacterium]